MTKITKILAIAVLMAVSACGTEVPTDPGCTTNCPPPEEVVGVVITSPSQGQVLTTTFASYPTITVAFTATGTSSISGQAVSFSWTIDGVAMTSFVVTPGNHTACVTATGKSKTASACVLFSASLPVMSGTLKSINSTLSFPVQDFVPSNGMVVIGEGAFQDTARIGTDGKWSINTRWAVQDTVKVWQFGDGMLRYVNPILVLKKDFSAVNIVTAPETVTIPSGAFANQQVVISLEKARRTSGDSSSGFYNRVGNYKTYPQPTAFCRGISNAPVSASDSVALWTQLNDVNFQYGRQLYKPANESEVCETNLGIMVVIDTTQKNNSGGVVNLNGLDYLGSRLTFRGTAWFSTPQFQNYVTHHEPIHALGFGHTCSWNSIMFSNCVVTPNAPFGGQLITAREDVAYALLMMAVVDEMRKVGTPYSVLSSKW